MAKKQPQNKIFSRPTLDVYNPKQVPSTNMSEALYCQKDSLPIDNKMETTLLQLVNKPLE